MAFRINLAPEQAATGFRASWCSVFASRTPAAGKKHLESLLDDHLHSRAGFELLTQGTATNNTDEESTGFSVHGDPGEAFDTGFRERPAFTTAADPLLRRDGEWFAAAARDLAGTGTAHAQRRRRDQLEREQCTSRSGRAPSAT